MAKVITGKVRLSYPQLFVPKPDDNGKLKYSCAILIPKSDTATYEKLIAAEKAATAEGKSGKWGGKGPNKDSVIKDGDLTAEDYPERAGHWMMSVSMNALDAKTGAERKPGVVDKNLEDIIDPSEVYAGCYVRVSMNSYAYTYENFRGVGFGLNNVQKVGDGDPLGAVTTSAADDFDAFEDDDII